MQRPSINREEGSTAAFSKAQARCLLDSPAADTVAELRDRAILSVGLQVGLRRAEIAPLTVGDLHKNRGLDALRLTPKGGKRDALAIQPSDCRPHPGYLELAGHNSDHQGPLFRPLRVNAKAHDPPAGWTLAQSIASPENMLPALACSMDIPRTRCAPRSSQPRLRAGSCSKTCRRRRGTETHPRQSFTTGAATTPRRQQASSQPIPARSKSATGLSKK